MKCEKYEKKFKNKEQYCGQCESHVNSQRHKIIVIIGIIIILSGVSAVYTMNKSKMVEVPNLVGMTVEEAHNTMNELGIGSNLKVYSCGNNSEIIQSQEGEKGTVKQGDYFYVYVYTNEYYEQRKKEKEEQNKITETIENFASSVRSYNGGSVKYSSYSTYKTSNNSEKVYKIEYKTSYDYMYYYQLVSLSSDNKTINKKTRLFLFSKYGNSSETGEKLELEYAYDEMWGK